MNEHAEDENERKTNGRVGVNNERASCKRRTGVVCVTTAGFRQSCLGKRSGQERLPETTR
jgi:hypothetical protein